MTCITEEQYDTGEFENLEFSLADEVELLDSLQSNQNEMVLVSSQSNRMRIAIGVVVRLVVPLYNGVARGLQGIRGINFLQLIKNVQASRQLLTNLLAYAVNSTSMSLSSVQVVHKIDPLLKLIKLRKDSKIYLENSSQTTTHQQQEYLEEPTEKCVTIKVLAEPSPGEPIRADIIFIHGLHGSLVNTWKQGIWNSEGRRVNIKRPPKPPVRPPKRTRHSRANLFDPPHQSKRPRFCPPEAEILSKIDITDELIDSENSGSIDYTYTCDESSSNEILEHLDNIYTFSTFRSRLENTDDSCDAYVPEVDNNINDNRIVQKETNNNSNNNNNNNSDNTKTEYSPCWPGDWLPLDCPGVRVISVNYTTDPYLWRPIWIRKRKRSALTERSREMMKLLTEIGVGVGHPIVWVGHSKGGIFIKQMIVDAWECGKMAYTPLWQSSRGVLFYSVPHRGSILADFNLPLLRQSVELMEIAKNSPVVMELHRRFVALYRGGHIKVQVFSFVETALTLMSVLYLRIVGIDSADPGIGEVCGIHLDHRQICKPRNRDCILYTELIRMINKVS